MARDDLFDVELVHNRLIEPDADALIDGGTGVDAEMENRGGKLAEEALILQAQRPRGRFRMAQRSRSKQTDEPCPEDQDEDGPADPLDNPRATCEFEIFVDFV